MPSDSKKKKEQQKKEARKKKDMKKPKQGIENGENEELNEEEEEEQEEVTAETNEFASASTKEDKPADAAATTNGDEHQSHVPHGDFGKKKPRDRLDSVDEIAQKLCALELLEKTKADNRACTGVLASHPHGRDIHISLFSLTFYGQEILVDANLELNQGRRYGILGLNGCGKSTVLAAISHREIPIPKHVDIFHLSREIPATDKTALEAVLDADQELIDLERQAEELCDCDDLESQDLLNEIYERMDELNSDMRETKAARILHGLGKLI